ncbi:MAG: DUF4147 domain-containing protein, partial [Patescibacteria group bacterium]
IKNKKELVKRFPEAADLLDIADDILESIDPEKLIFESFDIPFDTLRIRRATQGTQVLNRYKNIYVVGAGKATLAMAKKMNEMLGDRITKGYINVPNSKVKTIGNIIVNVARHPHPNQKGVEGSKKILKICESAGKDDLVIALISGGGSALMPLPADGLTLKDKILLTDRLLKCGDSIHKINVIRKHLSKIKGGRLAEAALPATVLGLYISDVVGDPLDLIASGPTVPDKSTSLEALEILETCTAKLPEKIEKIIRDNETPKKLPKDKIFNFVIGSNKIALQECLKQGKKRKYNVKIYSSELEGEARNISSLLINDLDKMKKPALLLAGGETTVTLLGGGQGGRNQELVLSAIPKLKKGMSILALATDGVDGITDEPIAGAVATYNTQKICQAKKVDVIEFISDSDSYNCLKQLGGLLKTGPTGTNVGDIILLKAA